MNLGGPPRGGLSFGTEDVALREAGCGPKRRFAAPQRLSVMRGIAAAPQADWCD